MKVAVTTLGCKVNQFDSAALTEKLQQEGFSIVPFGSDADICIINTCTVTARTDYQSRQLIRRAKKHCPEAKIVVTGCYAQVAPAELAELPGVAAVMGNAEKEEIPFILRDIHSKDKRVSVSDIRQCGRIPGWTVKTFPGRTRAFLRIQEGCGASCTYCIVPLARGPSRSVPEDRVLQQVLRLADAGYREVVLSGIHLGSYGLDLHPPTNLLTLLTKLDKSPNRGRIRLSSIEPLEIAKGMISRIAESESLCRHLHIPLQSGDDFILKRMGRNYRREQFKALVEDIVRSIPDIAIGLDVMAGFPGEGEREFDHTVGLIESLPVAYLHVFPYSERPGTPAAQLPGSVREDVKKKRTGILKSLGAGKRQAFLRRFVGKNLSVLVEGKPDRLTGWMKGFTDNYIPVLIAGNNPPHANRIVNVIAEEIHDNRIMGRIVGT